MGHGRDANVAASGGKWEHGAFAVQKTIEFSGREKKVGWGTSIRSGAVCVAIDKPGPRGVRDAIVFMKKRKNGIPLWG